MIFKEGDHIRCVNNCKVEKSLTIGKTYTVHSTYDSYVRIWSDLNRMAGYFETRFKHDYESRCINIGII